MKLGLMKRILATGLCVAMFMGDVLPAVAESTVSGGDAAELMQEAVVEEEVTEPAQETPVEETTVEPAQETPVEQETAAPAQVEDSVSGNDIVEIEEEALPLADEVEDIVLETEVSNVVITLTAPAGSLPEGAQLVAEEIAQTADLAMIDEALEAEVEKTAAEVQKYKAFDIKILVDGEEVQPDGDVTVSFAGDILLPRNEKEEVAVYHVSEDAVASDMEAVVTENATVEMETTHFSVYVIVVTEEAALDQYNVTVDHKLADGSKFYKAHTYTINKGQFLQIGVQGGGDYDVEKIVINGTVKKADGSTVETMELTKANGDYTIETTSGGRFLNILNNGDESYKIFSDVNVTLYYVSNESETFLADATFFDYSVLTNGKSEAMVLHSKEAGKDDELNFTYNGVEYRDYKPWNHLVDGYGDNVVYKANDKSNTVTFKDGDVLTKVEVNCWHGGNEGHENYRYSRVVVHEVETPIGTTYYYEAFRDSYVDAGININAFDENGNRKNNYLAVGILGFHGNELMVNNQYDGGNELDANTNSSNDWDGKPAYANKSIAEGLIERLDASDNYQTVIWGKGADGQKVNEPGYFTADAVEGKTIYPERFNLQFSKTGHRYVLEGSIDKENGNKFTKAGKGNAGFFPLNAVERNDIASALEQAGSWGETQKAQVINHGDPDFDENIGNNCYFGMRYDFQFTLGDYEGELVYTFEGDDDIWVFMDGELVLDLGGIHSAYPSAYPTNGEGIAANYVDLWQYIKAEDGSYDPNAEHQITVLYMERGGYDSNCYMDFTLPNATAMKSVISTKEYAEIKLNKVEKDSNQTLAGVIFTLTDSKGNSENAITDAQGNVKFEGLTEGTYTLTETALKGYYGAGPWTVVVTGKTNESGDKTVYSIASITSTSGVALTANNGIYTVVNEKIPPAVDVDKTVEVVDWDERTYKITLDASSLVTKVEKAGSTADIVLTLDISDSMNWKVGSTGKSRLDILKSSVNDFIDQVAAISDESRIAIVTYGGSTGTKVCDLTELNETGVKTLKTAVDNLKADGGTPQHKGFQIANEIISASTNENKYVVFVGDGEPDYTPSASDIPLLVGYGMLEILLRGEEIIVEHYAKQTKQNAIVVTLGIELNFATEQFMKRLATAEAYAYSVDNATDMTEVLGDIGDAIISALPVEDASIVDYIDNRFELIDEDGNVLAVGTEITDANGNVGYVREDSKGIYVEWNDVTIDAAGAEASGWTAELYVKAKDEFIGGNYIPTNGPGSGVTADDEEFPFPKPTTNVKLLGLDIEEQSTTLFKGDDITPDEYVTALNETLSIVNIEDEKIALADAPQLTEEQVATLLESKELTVPYSYEGEEIGSLVYAIESEYAWEDHTAEVVGENVESYQLKVYFEAKSEEDRAEDLGEGYDAPVEGTEEVSTTTPTEVGTYTVNVIAGSLTIKKTIAADDVNWLQGDPIFTFKVMKDGEFYSYHTVRYTKGSADTITVATLSDLEKGVYTVEECEALRYDLVAVNADGSADKEVDATVATFGIGRDIESADTQLTNVDGIASFTNERTNDRYYSDTEVVVNTFVIGEDGNISWTADTLK